MQERLRRNRHLFQQNMYYSDVNRYIYFFSTNLPLNMWNSHSSTYLMVDLLVSCPEMDKRGA